MRLERLRRDSALELRRSDGNNEAAPPEGHGASQTRSTMPMVNHGGRNVADSRFLPHGDEFRVPHRFGNESQAAKPVTYRRSRLGRSSAPTWRIAKHCGGAGRPIHTRGLGAGSGRAPTRGECRARGTDS
jgi:hypothetical protein